MKDLVQYIVEAFKEEEIDKRTVNVSWEKCGKIISKQWKNIPSGLMDYMKEIIAEDINNFYDKVPRKRSVISACEFNVYLKMFDNAPACVNKLRKLYNTIGMSNWMLDFEHGNHFAHGELVGESTTRGTKDLNSIKWKDFSICYYHEKKEDTNGYNHLSGDIITEYREKFLNCISDTEIIIERGFNRNSKINAQIPVIKITYNAIFDKSKVNKLIDEILNNDDFKKYGDSLSNVMKGIDKYYSSKRSGEYTGD